MDSSQGLQVPCPGAPTTGEVGSRPSLPSSLDKASAEGVLVPSTKGANAGGGEQLKEKLKMGTDCAHRLRINYLCNCLPCALNHLVAWEWTGLSLESHWMPGMSTLLTCLAFFCSKVAGSECASMWKPWGSEGRLGMSVANGCLFKLWSYQGFARKSSLGLLLLYQDGLEP